MLIAVLFTIAEILNPVSIDRWIDKENTVYKHNGILFIFEKEEHLTNTTTCLNYEDIKLSVISQT